MRPRRLLLAFAALGALFAAEYRIGSRRAERKREQSCGVCYPGTWGEK